jgi:hypothetical protein
VLRRGEGHAPLHLQGEIALSRALQPSKHTLQEQVELLFKSTSIILRSSLFSEDVVLSLLL